MALRPEDNKRVELITEAAAFLRAEGKEEHAASVDFVLTPEGRAFVNRLRVDQLRRDTAEGKFGQNLALAMPLEIREEIKAAVPRAAREERALAAKEGRDPVKISIPGEAEKALKAFVAGEFVPEQPQRSQRGAFEKKVNLNVRVDPGLRERAENHGADNAVEFGWAPRASHIIIGWLVKHFTEAGKAEAGQ